jgi:hypothetical protein
MPSSRPADSRNETKEEVPDTLVAGAKALFGRQPDGELAVLTHDSLVDGSDPASDHRIRFEHRSLVVDLHVSAHTTGSDLTGELRPSALTRNPRLVESIDRDREMPAHSVDARGSDQARVSGYGTTSAFRVELERNEGGASCRREVADRTFAFEKVQHGIVRLRLVPLGDGPSIRTDWFQI